MNQIKLFAIVLVCFALCSCVHEKCNCLREDEPGWLSRDQAMWAAQEILVKNGCPDAKLVDSERDALFIGKDCQFTFETADSTLRLVIHVNRKSGRAKIVQQIHLTQANPVPAPTVP